MESIDVIRAQITSNKKLTHTTTSSANWSYGICHVGDCLDMAFATFCCPCYAGVLAERMGESCLLGPMAWLGCNTLAAMRTKVREDLNINGSMLKDYVVTSCLPFCAMRQIKHELDVLDKLRE
ncbi:protein ORF31 [Cyprinid herpesvirus 1]|uniref:Protein ORF31 n=1 Tax=Cyprinid herpesvirus 1 TaxID=317858 RepID=K7PCJ9_9VIRU|nr:protein ORF31 [Cyprinid herpesvirus 1]AFJ20335.1 protein ORF31 [Cyprinid herpesvirus 1]